MLRLKNKVYVISFLQKKKQRKKSMKPEPAKNKVLLIKRTLPHVFLTLYSAPINHNYAYAMFQLHRDTQTKGRQGWRRPLKPTVSYSNRTGKLNQPFNSKPKHGMTHHFRQRGASHIHMEANIWKPNLIQKTLLTPTLFLTSNTVMVCFIQKWKNQKSMPLYHVYQRH